VVTLSLREVIASTPRARIARLDLDDHQFDYAPDRRSRSQPWPREAAAVLDRVRAGGRAARGYLELLIGVDADGKPGPHLTLHPGALVDVEGPLGNFTFPADPEERRFIFIAGGTGIARCARCCGMRCWCRTGTSGSSTARGRRTSSRSRESCAAWRTPGEIELRQTIHARDRVGLERPARPARPRRARGAGARPGDAVLRLRAAGAGRRDAEDPDGPRHPRTASDEEWG
jgi:hypothetical protein